MTLIKKALNLKLMNMLKKIIDLRTLKLASDKYEITEEFRG